MPDVKCGRCNKKIELGQEEYCAPCTGFMCYECWEEYGHCNCEESKVFESKEGAGNGI